jgi:hypothetical protein
MDKDVMNSFETLGRITNQLAEKRHAFLQHVLLVSVTLFGILISLHRSGSELHASRLCFAASICLLALGILLTGISLYGHIEAISQTRKAYLHEAQTALHEGRATRPVSAPSGTIYVFCEKACYVLLSLSLLLLSCYSIMTALF